MDSSWAISSRILLISTADSSLLWNRHGAATWFGERMEDEEGGKRDGDGDGGRSAKERPLRALERLRGWLLLSEALEWPKLGLSLYAIGVVV